MATSSQLGLLAAVLFAIAGGASALACSAPPAKGQTLVVDCEPDSEGCGDNAKKSGRSRDDGDSTLGTPTSAPETKEPTGDAGNTSNTGDAGAADSATTGPSCTALAACCDKLKTAGITGSANQCVGVASGGNEYACSLAHTDYRTPGDYYDPVCN